MEFMLNTAAGCYRNLRIIVSPYFIAYFSRLPDDQAQIAQHIAPLHHEITHYSAKHVSLIPELSSQVIGAQCTFKCQHTTSMQHGYTMAFDIPQKQ
jgi:hypothetical protein